MSGTSWSHPQKVGMLYLAVSAGGGTTRWLITEDMCESVRELLASGPPRVAHKVLRKMSSDRDP